MKNNYRMNSLYFFAIEENLKPFIAEAFKDAPGKTIDRPHAVLSYMPWSDDPELEELFCNVNQRKQIMSSRILISDEVSGIEFIMNGLGNKPRRIRVATKVAEGVKPMRIQSIQEGWRPVNPEERLVGSGWVRKQDYKPRREEHESL